MMINNCEKKSRGWCFTINNYDDDDEAFCFELALSATYVVVGKEVGESGTPHLQGFVYFPNPRALNGVRALHPSAHWEYQRGTCEQAADYCKKGGDYFEDGTCPMSQKQKGEAGKQSIRERWELAKAGNFEELPPEQIKTYQYIYRMKATVNDREELNNFWICGPSGCGKSRFVRTNYPGFYSKGMNKWWDGYNHEATVVLDDFDPTHGAYLGYFLKIWADHYAFNAEVKGGMMTARPKTVIVTSQYEIERCFTEPETVEAIKRRFQVIRWDYLLKEFTTEQGNPMFADSFVPPAPMDLDLDFNASLFDDLMDV